ncbi:hypothetical protein CERZMDRAFT_89177 [Cercospora zeae-maydis SCOH1-5]|uniref:Uncharacterized protein n=1 Tax=Cercospora zeae-maydis SCOH1-5 TaxID=717836 RepID=A0A6A6EYJ8_9PEZI|nr:hypothetical protein CERZMDRAFT_89177 [Cercospora zeae-maydis SCOH1-5]
MKFTKLIVALAGLTSVMGIRTWSSPTSNGNNSDLVLCMEEMRAMLEKNPRASHLQGYQCGSSMWHVGGTNEWEPIKNNLKAFRKCEAKLAAAVVTSRDWFLCKWTDMWGWRAVGYAPVGKHVCASCDPPWMHPAHTGPEPEPRRLAVRF